MFLIVSSKRPRVDLSVISDGLKGKVTSATGAGLMFDTRGSRWL